MPIILGPCVNCSVTQPRITVAPTRTCQIQPPPSLLYAITVSMSTEHYANMLFVFSTTTSLLFHVVRRSDGIQLEENRSAATEPAVDFYRFMEA